MPKILNIAAAGTLGVLLALLIALSVSPIAASTVATLLAAALLFLALNDKLPLANAGPLSSDILERIVSFSSCASIALLIGLYIRTHSVENDRSIINLYRDMKNIGLSDAEARNVSLEIYKSRIEKLTERERQTGTGVLFSNDASNSACSELLPSKYNDVANLEAKFVFYNGIWSKAINYANKSGFDRTSDSYKGFLSGVYAIICDPNVR